MADPAYAWVRIDALRDLVDYADLQRSYADSQFNSSDTDQQQSDDEFKALVDALGVEQLDR